MSVAKDLQIHSNVSIPKTQASFAVSKQITIQEEPLKDESPYIGKKNYRGFLIGSSLTLLFLHSMIIFTTIAFMFMTRASFMDYFDNYEKMGNGYDIASTILLFLTLILISVAPTFGRKIWKLLFASILFITVFYLSAFLLRQGMKTRLQQFGEYVIPIYMMFFSGAVSLFITILASDKKLNHSLAVSIAVPFFFLMFFIQFYVQRRISPKLWEIFLYLVASGVVAFYLSKDAELMIKKRSDFYLKNDWFLGFVHFQTDWVFRFWYDIFVSRPASHLPSIMEKSSHHDSFDTRLSLEEDIA